MESTTTSAARPTIALLGCGKIAHFAHGPGLAAAGARILCFDVHRPAAERFAAAFEATVCDSVEELWEQRPLGTIVATLPDSHAELAQQALAAGSHVKVEKPLTTQLADGVALVREARRRDLTVSQPFHQLLMLEDVLEAARAHRYGALDSFGFFWTRVVKGEGLLPDLSPHGFANALQLFDYDEIDAVSVEQVPYGTRVRLHHVWARIEVTLKSGAPMRFAEEVKLALGSGSGGVAAYARTTQTPSEQEFDYAPRQVSYRGEVLQPLPAIAPVDAVRVRQTAQWLASLTGDGPALPGDGALGIRVQALLDAAVESERTGRPVVPARLSDEDLGLA